MKNRVVITTNQILWTIILLNTSSDDWYIDYINDKLNYQIKLNDLEENINILILDKIEDIQDSENLGEYLNIINNGDISDNYIKTIYNNLEKTKKNCLCFSGIYKSKDGDYVFNQKEENSEEIFIPINKMNPIKREFVLKKFNNYIEGEFKKISAKFIDDILVYIDSDIDLNKTINQETKESFSIILTAYKTEKFIEECLDSIESQTYFENNDNYEILVGVDGCENTLNKLNEIKDKYRNLYIYMMKENRGTYMTTNALLNLIKYENVIRFDTDDIMEPNLVEDLVDFKNINDDDVIKLGYSDWREGKKINDYVLVNDGIIYFKKSVMDDIAGGYMPWECAADSELISRLKGRVKISGLNKRLFIRRIHDNNLTLRKDTGYKSVKRLKYNNQIKGKYNDDEVKIERVSNEIKNSHKCPISIIVTAYQTQNFIEECLDSIENQTYFKNNNEFEVLVGIDGCEDTLSKLKEIRHKYRNLRIFMMDTNMGTYVTSNTLLDLIKYDNILRFDSDDVMKPEMIKEIMNFSEKNDIIRFSFHNFKDNIKHIELPFMLANGAIFYKKSVIDFAGGYKNWCVSADLELIMRIKNHFKIKDIDVDKPLFYRRHHLNSLCNRKETNLNSQLRKNIDAQIREYSYNENILIKREVNSYKNVYSYININSFFDKIYCLNLDRRLDKWNVSNDKFKKLKLKVERYSAIDGNQLPMNVLNKYNKINKFEIGCMLSHYNIIKDAKEKGYKNILILEDDVLFTKDFNNKFEKLISQIPENYKLLYLGGTQHNWNGIEFINNFYYANGTDGTFAYSVSESVYDEILKSDLINNKPIDYKLWDIQKKFYKECYVCFPNLIIADVSNSDIRESRDNEKTKIKMKWNIYDYE